MGWGQVIGMGIDAIKSNKQQDAGNQGAAAQINAQNAGMQFDLAQYNQNRADNLNALVTGNSAVNALAKLYGLDYYTGQVNTNPITMSGGLATTDNKAPWYDPGGLFPGNGAMLSTTPITFGGAQTGGGGITSGTNALTGGSASSSASGSGGNTASGTGQRDYSGFLESPDYLFALQQGIQGQDRSAASRGGLYSGGHQADLVNYNQGMASQQLGNYTNNLMRIAGFGGQASGKIGSMGQSTAANVGNRLSNAGDARASSYVNNANAQGNMLSNWGQAFGDWYGQRQGTAGGNMLTGSSGSSQTHNIGPWW